MFLPAHATLPRGDMYHAAPALASCSIIPSPHASRKSSACGSQLSKAVAPTLPGHVGSAGGDSQGCHEPVSRDKLVTGSVICRW